MKSQTLFLPRVLRNGLYRAMFEGVRTLQALAPFSCQFTGASPVVLHWPACPAPASVLWAHGMPSVMRACSLRCAAAPQSTHYGREGAKLAHGLRQVGDAPGPGRS